MYIQRIANNSGRRVEAAPAFDILSLFNGGENGEAYDFTDTTKLFQDTGKTTPAVNVGDVIGAAVGLRGVADLLQATTASKPTISNAGSRLGAQMFAGASRKDMLATLSAMGGTVTIAASYLQRVTGTNPTGMVSELVKDASNRLQLYNNANVTTYSVTARILAVNYNTAAITQPLAETYAIAENDTSGPTVSIDAEGGSSSVASNASADFGTSLYIGRNTANAAHVFNGDIYRIVVIDRVLTAGEQANVITWLGGGA